MTVGNEGEPDDPYGYLYRPGPGDAQGGQEAPAGFGSSPYVQVGQTRYGQPQPYQQPAADPQATQPVPGMAQQPAPGGPPPGQVPPPRRDGGHGGGSRGSSRGGRGPVIGAVVAIVVVVAVIVAVVAMNGDDDDKKKDAATTPPPQTTATAQSSAPPTTSAAPSSSGPEKIGATEAEEATLAGGAAKANDGKGYTGNGFVANLVNGSSISWTAEVPKEGQYYLRVIYSNPESSKGGDGQRQFKPLTVSVNGKATSSPIKLYGLNSDTYGFTWGIVNLKEGSNSLALTCSEAAGCPVKVDNVSLSTTQPSNAD
ncbi:CBM35 domain-containing protein [Yinghuangia sp. YIM S09857]|uniref:CBM35 domain-containing protein n=1 Tax=Yinghuangia sp. YIM S09857 TaxID=3436929 RepID=UPI003F52C1E2